MRILATLAVLALAACATPAPENSAELSALQNAHLRSCPAERTQANAQTAGFGERSGVEVTDLAIVPSADDPTRAVRLRRIMIQPGGIIPWHDHTDVQGAAVLLSGEATELRNTCLDPMVYSAGDMALEDAATAHSWRNDGTEPVVVLVAHVVRVN
ncbi:MAG: cupin domain-containing protein [Hyphomonadaceae bacterium]|nr:cupin domain-containing protein [Hyphomonadaceae bacterium]